MFKHVSDARGAALFGLLLCSTGLGGCAQHSAQGALRSAPARQITTSALRRVSVVSANVAPRIPTASWQPSNKQSMLAGALAGGGAGAGVGAGVCTVSIFCPPCYAACVAALGVGGAAVGAFGGRIAHRQLASDPANRMLPPADELSARFRARTMATLSAQPGVSAEDGGSAALPFARDKSENSHSIPSPASTPAAGTGAPPDRVLEIALTDIHAEALRKGGFEVDMKARARLRNLATNKSSDVETFEYNSKPIAEGGGIEAEAQRIAAEVEHGMDEMARDIRDTLVKDD